MSASSVSTPSPRGGGHQGGSDVGSSSSGGRGRRPVMTLHDFDPSERGEAGIAPLMRGDFYRCLWLCTQICDACKLKLPLGCVYSIGKCDENLHGV